MHRSRALAILLCVSLLTFASFAQATASLGFFDANQLQNPQEQLPPPPFESISLGWFITVDCFAVGLVSGTNFYTPSVLTNFDHASWSQNTGLSTYADASGNPFPVLFDLNFQAPLAVGTKILAAGYAAGNLLVNVEGEYFGNSDWLFQDTPEPEWDPKGTVPEPATMLLLGTGIAAIAGRRMRRR